VIVNLVTVPTVIMIAALYFLNVPTQKGDVQILDRIDFKPGDILYHVNDGSYMIAHYARPDWPQYQMPSDWHTPGGLSQSTRDAMGFQIAPLEQLQFHRAWIVWAGNPMTPPEEEQALKDLLRGYVVETIYEKQDSMTHQAIYLVWNYRIEIANAVP